MYYTLLFYLALLKLENTKVYHGKSVKCIADFSQETVRVRNVVPGTTLRMKQKYFHAIKSFVLCGCLNENRPHWLIYLNVWSLVGGTVLEGLGVAFGDVTLWVGSEVSKAQASLSSLCLLHMG